MLVTVVVVLSPSDLFCAPLEGTYLHRNQATVHMVQHHSGPVHPHHHTIKGGFSILGSYLFIHNWSESCTNSLYARSEAAQAETL